MESLEKLYFEGLPPLLRKAGAWLGGILMVGFVIALLVSGASALPLIQRLSPYLACAIIAYLLSFTISKRQKVSVILAILLAVFELMMIQSPETMAEGISGPFLMPILYFGFAIFIAIPIGFAGLTFYYYLRGKFDASLHN